MSKCFFKILPTSLALLGLGSLAIIFTSTALAQTTVDFPYDIPAQTQLNTGGNEPTDLGQVLNTDAVDTTTAPNSILQRLTNFFRVSGTAYNPDNTGSPALNHVKWILNIVLGLVSFAALVLIIFAFYLIFFSKGEEAVTKAKKILTGVAIALFIIGLSRLIVSYFFDIFITTTA